jgi:hypothetical protein
MVGTREPILHPIPILSLRPTQMTVGMREVEEKRRRWRASRPPSKAGEQSRSNPRGGKLINWLKGNEAPLEGKIPMPKGDPRRLPDGSILPMPTGDPRNQIPDFPVDIVPRPMRDSRRFHNGKRIPFPMPVMTARTGRRRRWMPARRLRQG